jgi:hypothetical protein
VTATVTPFTSTICISSQPRYHNFPLQSQITQMASFTVREPDG